MMYQVCYNPSTSDVHIATWSDEDYKSWNKNMEAEIHGNYKVVLETNDRKKAEQKMRTLQKLAT